MAMSKPELPHVEPTGKYALVVGVNEYKDAARFTRLPGCAEEANAFGQLLATNDDGSENFGNKHIQYFANAQVTKEKLKSEAQILLGKHAELVIFYFSGHGADLDTGGVLVTHDSRPGEEGLVMNDLVRWASLSPAKSVVLVLDCCFSGQVGNIDFISLTGKRIAQLPEKVAILTASAHNEKAAMLKGHSVFTKTINKGLMGAAANAAGEITLPLLYEFVARAFERQSQTPQLKSYINHSARIRRVKPVLQPA
jgi:uncharacterized caspase-like protein